MVNELRYGGAKYVATGRGLPTYRRPFIGETEPGTTKLKKASPLAPTGGVVRVWWYRYMDKRGNATRWAASTWISPPMPTTMACGSCGTASPCSCWAACRRQAMAASWASPGSPSGRGLGPESRCFGAEKHI